MTRLPMDNIEHVPPWKFRLLRRLMFPRGTLSYETIAGLRPRAGRAAATIAAERNVKLVEQSRAWYSWDPIHIKSEAWPQAWHHILSGWTESPPPPAGHNAGLDRMIYLRHPRAAAAVVVRHRAARPSTLGPAGRRERGVVLLSKIGLVIRRFRRIPQTRKRRMGQMSNVKREGDLVRHARSAPRWKSTENSAADFSRPCIETRWQSSFGLGPFRSGTKLTCPSFTRD